MGMDVSGKAPTTEAGAYFRASVWGWHPLWDYCEERAPGIAGKVEHAHTNDGDGLDARDSRRLAAVLRRDLKNGTAERYVKERDAELAALPMETCNICDGTGQRKRIRDDEQALTDEQMSASMAWCGGCNGCSGTGKVKDWATHYHLDTETIREFATFLDGCGGFAIW